MSGCEATRGASPATARDIRQSDACRAVNAFYADLFAPGTGHIAMVREIAADPSGRWVFFTGLSFGADLTEGPASALYRLERETGDIVRISDAGRLGCPSPDGARIAYATDEGALLLDADLTIRARFDLGGRIEQLAWSPDGTRLALLVAGAGADVSGIEGGFAMEAQAEGPAWLPEIDTGGADDVWRQLWLWDVGADTRRCVTAPPVNVWEFCWAGPEAFVVVASDDHGEGSWYAATLRRVEIATGMVDELYRPADQIALPRAGMDGHGIAFVEAVCSDRGLVCGTLTLLDAHGARPLETGGAEVSDLHWVSPSRLAYAGLRGLETVVGHADIASGDRDEIWSSTAMTCGEWHPAILPDGDGAVLIAAEAWASAPALMRVRRDGLEMLHSFAAPGSAGPRGVIAPVRWRAADGLEIQGWLIRDPDTPLPAPLLIDVHGGPISAHRNRWAARLRAAGPLVERGWCVLLPNMRGATGRGQDFARHVVKDMGGADARDLLDGLDHLVAQGIADPRRIAVTGNSYGGFMSAWLVTQTRAFAAAAPISPIGNWFSQHYTSQIGSFDEICLEGSPRAPGGQYFDRSPVFAAMGAATPTLILAGARDKNTPPTQALEFHRALLEAGCVSALGVYPQDGHSLRGYPAYLDSAARVMLWFETHVTGRSAG